MLFYALPNLVSKLEEEQAKDSPDTDKIFEFDATVQFIQEHFGAVRSKLDEFPDNHIDFSTLWTLFPYHAIVYSSDQLGQGRAYRVRDSSYGKNQDGSAIFTLAADYIDSNGEEVGYVRSQSLTSIPEFSGSKLIYDLPYIPLRLHCRYAEARKQLIATGDKVLSLKGRHLQEYKGHALAEGNDKISKFNVRGIHNYDIDSSFSLQVS